MRRRMLMNKALPYDAEVEWIKSDGGYIDTGIKASGNLSIRTTLYNYFTEKFLGNWCFGGRNGYLNKAFGAYIDANTKKVNFAYSNQLIYIGDYQNYPQVTQVEIGAGNITIGDKHYSYSMETFTSDYNLQLFGLNNGGNVITYDDITMGDTYVTDGVTTLDLITVRKNGKGYMYDRISGKLLGTGDFIAGPDKKIISYLKSIGCKLWLPLNSEYGLEAAIGNTRIVNVVSNAVTINATVDMGDFRLGGVDVPVATLTTDWTSADFPNDEWTLFSQGRRFGNSNSRGAANVFKFIPTNNFVNGCFDTTGTLNSQKWDDEIQSCFCLVDSAVLNRIHFSESGTKTNIPEGVSSSFAKPNKEPTISIASYATWTNNKRIYLKNVMIFNRHLTEDEMQKVLGIIRL